MNLDRALAQSKHSTPKCSGPTACTRWVTCPLGFWIRYLRTGLRDLVAIELSPWVKKDPKRQCGGRKKKTLFFFQTPIPGREWISTPFGVPQGVPPDGSDCAAGAVPILLGKWRIFGTSHAPVAGSKLGRRFLSSRVCP